MSDYQPWYRADADNPQPRKRYTGWIIVGIVGGTLVACCLSVGIIGAVGNHNAASAVTATIGPSATPAPPTATPKPKKWTAIYTFSGNGNQTTGRFTMSADDWRLVWSCNPASSYFGSYNVAVDVDYADGSAADPAAVNTICQAGNTHGTTDVQNVTGSVYLNVLSENMWTIKVEVFE